MNKCSFIITLCATLTLSACGSGNTRGSINLNNEKNYIVVGLDSNQNSVLLKSTDGINWNNIPINLPFTQLLYASYGNSQYVIGGVNPLTLQSTLLSSSNGTIWNTNQSLTLSSTGIFSINFLNKNFIALGISPTNPALILTSSNGLNWSSQTSNLPVNSVLSSVAYGNNEYLAVGEEALSKGTAIVATSSDGVNWTQENINLPNNAYALNQVAYGDGKFVATGVDQTGNPIVLSSLDGINWSNTQNIPSKAMLHQIIFANNQFIIVGTNEEEHALVLTSQDGSSWVNQTNVATIPAPLINIIYANNQYIAIGNENQGTQGIILTSQDGANWNLQSTLNVEIHGIATNNN